MLTIQHVFALPTNFHEDIQAELYSSVYTSFIIPMDCDLYSSLVVSLQVYSFSFHFTSLDVDDMAC